jgi:hypothetical protein
VALAEVVVDGDVHHAPRSDLARSRRRYWTTHGCLS